MPVVRLDHELDFDGWRRAARSLRLSRIQPEDVVWTTDQADLFGVAESPAAFSPPSEAPLDSPLPLASHAPGQADFGFSPSPSRGRGGGMGAPAPKHRELPTSPEPSMPRQAPDGPLPLAGRGLGVSAQGLRAAPPSSDPFPAGGKGRVRTSSGSVLNGDTFLVPADFIDLAQQVICHRRPHRFDLLYTLLWRLRTEPDLLALDTDPDVKEARHLAREVARASHKMKAFVRFRLVEEDPETYCAWFEPPHRVLQRTAPFFVARFANLRFSILTPDACAHWDGTELSFTRGADKGIAPGDDALEDYWRTYYASIFNPARLKTRAMQAQMPKRYWRNLPEAQLIPELTRQAKGREAAMVSAAPTEPRRRVATKARAPARPPQGATVPTLADLPAMIDACRRCDLYKDATQGVPGQGPHHARLMLVGEQPGDQEDLQGQPFVGPAGKVLNRALEEAGVPRAETYVTNAVKHFKHELRGKRRLHKTPDGGEVAACRWWLDEERRLLRPRLILAMGGTAALSVFGKPMPIGKNRGQVFQLEDQSQAMITVHPSYLLRMPDPAAKKAAYAAFVEDLAQAWKVAG